MVRDALLVTLAGLLAGFLLHRGIPLARACMAPLDTGATYDLTLGDVTGTADAAAVEKERARWPETATLDLAGRRIELPDGTAVVFE